MFHCLVPIWGLRKDLNMQEIVKLKTACGCSRLWDVPRGKDTLTVCLILADRDRAFKFNGKYDEVGRRIFKEVIDE